MKYKELSDYEIIEMIKQGDKEGMNYLYHKYLRVIISMSYGYYLKNHTQKDIIQIMSMTFINAIYDYDPNRDASFITYITTCMRNDIIDRIRHDNTQKNSGRTESLYSPVNPDVDSELLYVETVAGDTDIPEHEIVEMDLKERFIEELKKNNLPEDVLRLREEDKAYSEIALELNHDQKSLYYKIGKIKKKMKEEV